MRMSLDVINPLTRGLVLLSKSLFAFSYFWSRINEPIPGMFVLIWMHFSLWFQIWSWNSKMFLPNLIHFWPVVCTRLPCWHTIILARWQQPTPSNMTCLSPLIGNDQIITCQYHVMIRSQLMTDRILKARKIVVTF